MFKALTIEEIEQRPDVDKLGDLNTLTMFYDPARDEIILNSSYDRYSTISVLTESYLTADVQMRENIKMRIKSCTEELVLLDRIIQRRFDKEMNSSENIKKRRSIEFKMIGEHKAFWKHLNFLDDLNKRDREPFLLLVDAFSWGYIQGVKAERARRKKLSHV